jgi:transposase-like protein
LILESAVRECQECRRSIPGNAEIAISREAISKLARRNDVTAATIRKWPSCTDFQDCSPTTHHSPTTLSAAQETIVIQLRKTLRLPLDDLLALTGEFPCPAFSRSRRDCCLRRHEVGNLRTPRPVVAKAVHSAFMSALLTDSRPASMRLTRCERHWASSII